MEKAIFAAGSFWTAEAAFQGVPGVVETCVGYSGGQAEGPTHAQVTAGGSGHAEVVLIDYDPGQVSYRDLLEVFWEIHDPTDPGGRGAAGSWHRRSVIFVFDPLQRAQAEAFLRRKRAGAAEPAAILTEILPAGPFHRAEDHHQRHLERRGLMVRSLFGD